LKALNNNAKPEALKGDIGVWLCLRKDGAKLRWEGYAAALNQKIEDARASGKDEVAVGDRKLQLSSMREVSKAGKGCKLCTFRVLWEWDTGEGGKHKPEWKPYPPELQWMLETAICSADAFCELDIEDRQYVVDLVGLRQYSTEDSFRCRRVRRRGVPLAAPFPAHVRDVKTDSWLDLTYRPPYWQGPSASSSGGSAGINLAPKRHDLPKDSDEFALIAQWMDNSIRTGHAAAYGQCPGYGGPLRSVEVLRIEVVQQPQLWRRYLCFRGKMKAQAKAVKAHNGTTYLKKNPMATPLCDWLDQDVNEAYFWHGSGKSPDGKVDLIDAIVSVGHEPSDENAAVMEVSDGASSRFAKNTSMFGSGVYLADLSSKANLYVPCPVCHQGAYFRDPCHCTVKEVEAAQPYRMLLCRAVLGRVYVEKKYSDARYKGEFNPALKLGADSVMGEVTPGKLAFREYVVYNDSASYPEFVIHYKRLPKPKSGGFGLFGGPPKKKAKKS